jgi:hypothetical protein
MTNTMQVRLLRYLVLAASCGLLSLATFLIERQGFNLLDDGLWLLGARIVGEGGILYRDMFTIYGPASYYALLPFIIVLGESARTLVLFKAMVTGIAAGLAWTLGRQIGSRWFAVLAPLSLLAIGSLPVRYLYAAAFAWLVVRAEDHSSNSKGRAILVGAAMAGLGLFGLDMFIGGAVILGASWLFAPRERRPTATVVRRVFVGLGGSAIAVLAVLLVTNTADTFLWDTVICPASNAVVHLSPFRENARQPNELGRAFADVHTGESLGPAWTGHEWQLRYATMSAVAVVLLIPILAIRASRSRRHRATGPLIGLSLTGCLVMLWRIDTAHIGAALYLALIVASHLLATADTVRLRWRLLIGAFVVLTLLPFAGERAWLLRHHARHSLADWDRDGAGIAMSPERIKLLEQVLFAMSRQGTTTIAWPAHPGLVFLAGMVPASTQATLLPGSVRDERAVVAEITASQPERLVIGRALGLTPGTSSLQSLTPTIWTWLRGNYVVEQQLADGHEGFQVLHRDPNAGTAPLEHRLPGPSQLVKNSKTQVIGPHDFVTQTLYAGGLDLRGLTILVATEGSVPAVSTLILRIGIPGAGERPEWLKELTSPVEFVQEVQPCTLSFAPIQGTAGRRIVIEVRINPVGAHRHCLLQHDPESDAGRRFDYYPEGNAAFNGRPLAGDLFFVTY